MKKLITLTALLLTVCMLLSACGQPAATEKQAEEPVEAAEAGESTERIDEIEAAEEVLTEKFYRGTIYTSTNGSLYERQTAPDTLTVGVITTIQANDPMVNTMGPATQLIYDTLFRMDVETGEIQGQLVKEWDWVDETHLHIVLRDDVCFSNGVPFTTEDVVFNFQRLSNDTLNTYSYSTWGGLFDFDNFEIISDTEMVIATTAVRASLLNQLAELSTGMVSKQHIEEVGEEAYFEDPIGTGPFVQTGIVASESQTFELNPYWWGEEMAFSKVVVRQYSEAATMFIDFENGVLDCVYDIAAQDAQRILDGELMNTKLYLVSGSKIYNLCFDDQDEYFSNPLVREAVAHAINYEGLAKVGFGILGEVATSMFHVGMSYRIDCGTYEYDPDLSRQLLAEAGYPDGFSIEVYTVTGVTSTMMEALQSMLADIGITMTVNSVDQPTNRLVIQGKYVGDGTHSDTPMGFTFPSNSNNDPDSAFVGYKVGSGNLLGEIHDDTVQNLFSCGALTVDDAERAEIYAELQQNVYDNVWVVPCVNSLIACACRDYIDNFSCDYPAAPNLRYITFVDSN